MRPVVRQAGQLVMAGFHGQTASTEIKQLIRNYGIGGVVFFGRNVDTPEQLAELVRELQECARDAGHSQPLLLSVDQEGGRVARLGAPWTRWPPLRVVGRGATEDEVRAMAAAIGDELRACGLTLDFAPVVDVDTYPANPVIGDRSFNPDPERVARLGTAFVQGLQAARVAACAKHFPGHGDTTVDSHLELPALELSRSRLEDVELRPFRAVVDAGVASIMVGHLLVREWDEHWPATLSEALVEGLLRRSLGFRGLVIADDLEMSAVAQRWSPEELGCQALRAGCDLLLACADHDLQAGLVESLVHAVESETLPWSRLDDAAGRVRELKRTYVEPYSAPDPRQARLAAGTARAQDLARSLAQAGGLSA